MPVTPSSKSPGESKSRNFSFAVTIATLRPARAAAARMVSQRRKSALFIITSSPVSGSKKKLPLNPVTTGGCPVTMAALFTFVNDGNAPRAIPRQPPARIPANCGMRPCSSATLRYASSHPSTHTTAIGPDANR